MDSPSIAPVGQSWPQHFRHLVIANSRYWLRCAQKTPNTLREETPQVLQGLTYALILPDAWPSARDLIIYLSPTMIRQGQVKSWEAILRKSITASVSANDTAEVALRQQLGTLYRLQGRLVEAQHCLHEALNLCPSDQSQSPYWTILTQLALVARLLAHHDEALHYCQQVLTETSLPPTVKAEALNVKGLVAYDQRQWETALSSFEQALALYRSAGETYETARLLTNRGVVFQRENRSDEAEASYKEAIQHFQNTDDQTEQFKAVMNLGNIFLMRQAFESAISYYQQALPVFQQCNYLVDLANVYNNLGMAYNGLGEWPTAETYFRASIDVWRSLEDKGYNLANVLDNFGEVLITTKQYKTATIVLREALHLLRSIPDNSATHWLEQSVQEKLVQLKGDYSV
ncbi:MAG: tetratricopeptide repeat protein [Anaerolineae bacterium]|nr:tetratricopeptide repeat protein [Anaerolineae bacterium]